jgi:MHS family proline/betaine transporter-like MFS transporter
MTRSEAVGAGSAAMGRASSRQVSAVIAGIAGNVLEWYDFAVYAFLVPVLSKLFFPNSEPMTATLLALAVFGSGFVMRPLGAIVFASYGDKAGRRAALMAIVLVMGLATCAIGFLPTYETAGVIAPIALVVLRLIQGFSSGGEWGGSATFLVEHGQNRRGFYGSVHVAGIAAGILLGSFTVAILNALISSADVAAWGWRIPFLLGIAVAIVGLVIRQGIAETPSFAELQAKQQIQKAPLRAAFKHHRRAMLTVFGIAINFSIASWLILTYMTTYLISVAKLPASSALQIGTIGLLVDVVALLGFGALSDRIGRKPIIIGSSFNVGQ